MSATAPANRTPTGIDGVIAGHWTHASKTTGVTLLVFPQGAIASCAILGAAPSTRQIDALSSGHVSEKIYALCFVGGSAFGLAAADGVMSHLAERRIGFDTGPAVVPIVPTAAIFDLRVARAHPDAAAGLAAARAASSDPLEEGPVGAGAGARFAKWSSTPLQGGVGCWSSQLGAWRISAAVILNAVGCVKDPETQSWVGGVSAADYAGASVSRDWQGGNTTLVALVTDAPLARPQCATVARMASAGLARTCFPAFTPFDGDIVFAASTASRAEALPNLDVARLGHGAAAVVERAVLRAAGSRG